MALAALVACLGIAGVVVPGRLLGSSKNATLLEPEASDAAIDAASTVAPELERRLRIEAPDGSASRPERASNLFFWPEELASGKTIGELWNEEDSRPPVPVSSPVEAPSSRPSLAPEDLEKARSIEVRGIVVGLNARALLSTGRVKIGDRIAGSPFKVERIDAKSVTLMAEGERVVLELASPRPGRVRTHPN